MHANATSLPVNNLPSVSKRYVNHLTLMFDVSAKPSSHGNPAC